METFHRWNEANSLLGRGSRFRRRGRFNSRIVFSSFFFIDLVMEQWDCRHLLSFMLVHIAFRFNKTDLSLLIRLSVIEVKRKEVVTVTSVPYLCKTLKAS